MSEIMCAAPLVRGSEFFLNDQGQRLFGTCGQRALASAASSVLGTNVSPLGIYDSMRTHGWADPSGACTIGGLDSQALQMNLPVADLEGYGEPWSGWLGWLSAQINVGNPVVLEVANGQALVDSVSGEGENAQNLQYHFIAVLGMDDHGFWCADGCSFAGGNNNQNGFNAANVLQYYTDAVMGAARPCAALALRGRAIKMAWTLQSNGRGLDDQGHDCGPGMIKFLQSDNLMQTDGLMSETYFTPSESFLPMTDGQILTWTGSEVVLDQGAQVLTNVWGQLEAARKATSTPAPAPVPEADPTATALVAAIKAALAA